MGYVLTSFPLDNQSLTSLFEAVGGFAVREKTQINGAKRRGPRAFPRILKLPLFLVFFACLVSQAGIPGNNGSKVTESRRASDDNSSVNAAGTRASSSSAGIIERTFEPVFSSKRFAYLRGQWFNVAPQSPFSIDSKMRDRICSFVASTLVDDTLAYHCAIVDSVISPALRSTYYLFAWAVYDDYIVPMSVSYVRQRGPKVPPEPLYSESHVITWYPGHFSLEHKVAILIGDLDSAGISAIGYESAAIDVVSILEKWPPVIFVRDLAEAWEFSEKLGSEWLWELAEVDDSVAALLARARLVFPGDYEFLETQLHLQTLPDLDSFQESEVVHPPQVIDRSEDVTVVELYTWTPCHGSVVEWRVHFWASGSLEVDRRVLIKRFGYSCLIL